jgi:hypothetical protein
VWTFLEYWAKLGYQAVWRALLLGLLQLHSFHFPSSENCKSTTTLLKMWHLEYLMATINRERHNLESLNSLHFLDILRDLKMMKPWQPYINPSTQKRGKQGTKWKDPHPKRQMNHLRGWTTRRTSSSQRGTMADYVGL